MNLYLDPMSLDDATQLAREAGDGLDDATAERIARHAGGNPFFIVETTGMLLHTGEGISADTGPLPEGLLPPTVQAVVAARIDHLAPDARDLIRRASVFARSSFTLDELRLIAGPTDEVLEELEDEEVLERDLDRPDVWRFQHRLVRDVAYESLPKRERQRLHLTVAEGSPAIRSGRPVSAPDRVASGARGPRRARPEPGRPRAGRSCGRGVAARRDPGARGSRHPRGRGHLYHRALDLAGSDAGGAPRGPDHGRPRRGAVLAGRVRAAIPVLEQPSRSATATRRPRPRPLASSGTSSSPFRGDAERAGSLLEDALAAARDLGDPWTLARTLLVAGWGPYWRGDQRARPLDVRGGARHRPREPDARSLGRVPGARRARDARERDRRRGGRVRHRLRGARDRRGGEGSLLDRRRA